ncbi:MAG: sulfatase-like hydrolase/transferase [Acidobacteria bacterium]|nr:sulfatase-like hydrolase/transferase [Acidobacteriota bacterium]
MDCNRRDILKSLPAAALARGGQVPVGAARSGPRPNILIVMSDQQRAGLTRASGFPLDTMPALDGMSARGVRFDQAYTTAPLCVPARISMLTGRWPHAHRVRQNSAANAATFDKDLFHVCRDLGYRTGLSGKNHSHLTPARVDLWRPFSHLDGWLPDPAPKELVAFEKWMKLLNHGTGQEPTPFPVETQFPHRIVSSAIEFIDSAKNDPFALWVSFPEPHNPYQVPKPYFDMFPPDRVPPRDVGLEALASKSFRWRWLRQLEERTYPGYADRWQRTRSNYLGMLRMIDDQVGRLLGHLESSGKARNTIVVYLADHGDFFCDYGLERKGAELPEVLTRIPMTWSGWNIRPQAQLPAFVSTADVLPTLCEAIGAEIPFGSQGRSLWPMLTGQPYPKSEFESIYSEVGFGGLSYGPGDVVPPNSGRGRGTADAIPTYDELNSVTQSGTMKMVRMGDWKLVFDSEGAGEIYNVVRDPYELKNLWAAQEAAEIKPRLLAELLRWTMRTQDDLPKADYTPKRAAHGWYGR